MTVTATRYARVLRSEELRDGELIPVEIDGTPVVLVRHAGEFFAVQNNCSHRDFPLSHGEVDPEACTITCEWHGATFDLKTGVPQCPPAVRPVPVFQTRVENGSVFVEIPD